MIKKAVAALGILGLLASVAIAAPPPNDVGVTGRGGGVYYNPFLAKHQALPAAGNQRSDIGTTAEGGGVYRTPT